MANLSIIDGNYRDGTRAVARSNDNIQVKSKLDTDHSTEGGKVHVPVVALDKEVEIIDLLEEQNLLLRTMIKHLGIVTDATHITEDDLDGDN